MEFCSLLFIYGFFPLSVLIFMLTPKKFRNGVLLAESALFCGLYGLSFLVIIISAVIWNYLFGLLIGSGKKQFLRRILLFFGIAGNLSLFFVFRISAFNVGLHRITAASAGICFLTLNTIGYLLDVNRKKTDAERDIFRLGLYLMLFTKFPMGPIVNYKAFSAMLDNRDCNISTLGGGIELFIIGAAKKIFFADNLYALYDAVHSMNISEVSAISAWLGSAAYLLCLYFTLSGYSDMGAGLSQCFGFHFRKSFDYPCVSSGLGKFCRSWHISVVKWFDEYFIAPLRKVNASGIVQIAVFILSRGIIGLWYSFRPGLFIWGCLIGSAAVIERRLAAKRPLRATALIYTSIILLVCTVFFFGDTLSYSLRYLFAMVGGTNNIADTASLTLFKTYIVVFLVGLYASTDLFRNVLIRSKKRIIKAAADILTPFFMLALLILCTALISGSGESAMMLNIL
ncbi:MAG: hypothetical protein PUA81_07630 [Oscillospiraceae bacterium]|nr:hypothetical protein [Oscillospiraceae bacterium]